MEQILGLDAKNYKEITIGELEEIVAEILKEQPDFILYMSFRANKGIPTTLDSSATSGNTGAHSMEMFKHFRTKVNNGIVAESSMPSLFAYIIQQYNALPIVRKAFQKFNTNEKTRTGDSTTDQSPQNNEGTS